MHLSYQAKTKSFTLTVFVGLGVKRLNMTQNNKQQIHQSFPFINLTSPFISLTSACAGRFNDSMQNCQLAGSEAEAGWVWASLAAILQVTWQPLRCLFVVETAQSLQGKPAKGDILPSFYCSQGDFQGDLSVASSSLCFCEHLSCIYPHHSRWLYICPRCG